MAEWRKIKSHTKCPGSAGLCLLSSRSGTSMIIVICVSAFFVAFALALVHMAGLLMARANARLEQERAYQLARSYAQVLEEELFKYNDKPYGEAPEDSFYDYANDFLKGLYGEYDPYDEDATVYHYTAASPAGVGEEYGTVRVLLRKEQNQENDEILTGSMDGKDVDSVKGTDFLRYVFTVDVIVELGDVSYTYQTEYNSRETYEVQFTAEGHNLVWMEAENAFRIGNNAGDRYCDVGEHEKWKEITYTYNPEKITFCRYERIYEDAP